MRISALVRALAAIKPAGASATRLLGELLAGTVDPADDMSKLATAPAPESIPDGRRATPQNGPPKGPLKGFAMSGVTMNFSGTVTIYVGNGDTAIVPASVPATAGATVAPEKTLRFDPDYGSREGYDAGFLGNGLVVPAPTVAAGREGEMLTDNGAVLVLKYHHYSLAMNAQRRLQMWSAANVDYDPGKRTVSGRAFFGTDRWIGDPRIAAQYQLADANVYGPATQIDRGHIVRREDSAWGDSAIATEFANSDTFHWTNCTPQHAAFNRSQPGSRWAGVKGLWGGFENHVQKNLQTGDTRACILTGPVLDPADPTEDFGTGPVQYPLVFWKVVVVGNLDSGGTRSPRSYGFLLSQKDVVDRFGVEFAAGEYARYQVPLAAISTATGVVFDAALIAADTHAT